MRWNPPWASRGLGYFTTPKTVEYRVTRSDLSVIFERPEDQVPHGLCLRAGALVKASANPVFPRTFAQKIGEDRSRWIKRGGSAEAFDKLEACVYLADKDFGRSKNIDIRAHERLHARALRADPQDLRILKFMEDLFERSGEDRFLPLAMRNFAAEKRLSARGNNMEEMLARVEGFEAAMRDAQRSPKKAEQIKGYLDVMTTEYGGRDFTRFREALKRTGYTPARVLREALR
jgi:hypothetical protein